MFSLSEEINSPLRSLVMMSLARRQTLETRSHKIAKEERERERRRSEIEEERTTLIWIYQICF